MPGKEPEIALTAWPTESVCSSSPWRRPGGSTWPPARERKRCQTSALLAVERVEQPAQVRVAHGLDQAAQVGLHLGRRRSAGPRRGRPSSYSPLGHGGDHRLDGELRAEALGDLEAAAHAHRDAGAGELVSVDRALPGDRRQRAGCVARASAAGSPRRCASCAASARCTRKTSSTAWPSVRSRMKSVRAARRPVPPRRAGLFAVLSDSMPSSRHLRVGLGQPVLTAAGWLVANGHDGANVACTTSRSDGAGDDSRAGRLPRCASSARSARRRSRGATGACSSTRCGAT